MADGKEKRCHGEANMADILKKGDHEVKGIQYGGVRGYRVNGSCEASTILIFLHLFISSWPFFKTFRFKNSQMNLFELHQKIS